MVEYPIGEYDFSLVRHFLFDNAELIRYQLLADSAFEPLSKLARKFTGELKYHKFHADTFMLKLGAGTEESHRRMQDSLDFCWNLALGMFEESPFENELKDAGIWKGEEFLKQAWLDAVEPVIIRAELAIPDRATWKPAFGGRMGEHTPHLQPLLEEMSEVFRIDPGAEW
jgi:ring-1,2-phenylacetyl-CoA epoxidase subunit PaaC